MVLLLLFFSYLGVGLLSLSFLFMFPVLNDYFQTGLVERLPTWIFSISLLMMALMVFSAGIILDSLAKSRIEQKRIFYMMIENQPSAWHEVKNNETKNITDLKRVSNRMYGAQKSQKAGRHKGKKTIKTP